MAPPRLTNNIVRLSRIQRKQVNWLWPEHIPLGKLTMIAGDPGLGKSTLTMDFAARVTGGYTWPNRGPSSADIPGEVILLTAEDDLGDTVLPRLLRANGYPERVMVMESVTRESGRIRGYDLTKDIPLIEGMVERMQRPKLLIFDPISAYMGGTDSHKNTDVRSVLAPLADLAARQNIAVLCVSHLNKGEGGKAVYRTMGSLAFTAAARAVWMVTRDKNDRDRRLFLPVKMNIGPEPSALSFTVQDGMVVWDEETVSISADEALSDPTPQGRLELAENWLHKQLHAGPAAADDVMKAGKQSGHTEGTLRRVKANLNIVSRRSHGIWYWLLPDHDDADEYQTMMYEQEEPTVVPKSEEG